MTFVALDHPKTWPRRAGDLLTRHAGVLCQRAEFERKRYAGLGSGTSEREATSAVNPFEQRYREILAELGRIFAGHLIVAFHCTRLTEDEISLVNARGLRCLTDELMAEKLARRIQAGDLSRGLAEELAHRCRSRTADAGSLRRGRIWGVLGQSALQDEQGLSNALRYWGGECVLSLVDRREVPLASIGIACV